MPARNDAVQAEVAAIIAEPKMQGPENGQALDGLPEALGTVN
jgi:hypothetical protein